MEDGGFRRNGLMRLTLGFSLIFLIGTAATGAMIFFTKMGLSADAVVRYYRGSEADFQPARSAASMLEVTHTHLPMMGLVLLFLTHLAIFAPFSKRGKSALIVAAFLGALADEGGGWLVRFVSPAFAWVKIAGFLTLEASLLLLIVLLAGLLSSGHSSPHRKSH
jgi:hypothetical protein